MERTPLTMFTQAASSASTRDLAMAPACSSEPAVVKTTRAAVGMTISSERDESRPRPHADQPWQDAGSSGWPGHRGGRMLRVVASIKPRIRLVTAEDLPQLPDDDRQYELVEGCLVSEP